MCPNRSEFFSHPLLLQNYHLAGTEPNSAISEANSVSVLKELAAVGEDIRGQGHTDTPLGLIQVYGDTKGKAVISP